MTDTTAQIIDMASNLSDDQLRRVQGALEGIAATRAIRAKQPAEGKVAVYAVTRGSTVIVEDRAAYEAAKADDMVDHLLDCELSDIGTKTVVFEEDGSAFRPY